MRAALLLSSLSDADYKWYDEIESKYTSESLIKDFALKGTRLIERFDQRLFEAESDTETRLTVSTGVTKNSHL